MTDLLLQIGLSNVCISLALAIVAMLYGLVLMPMGAGISAWGITRRWTSRAAGNRKTC